MSSCSLMKHTATHTGVGVMAPFTVPVVADLEVSSKKISYEYWPTSSVQKGGTDNVINAAVSKALLQNGNADVLVGLETQIECTMGGKVERVIVTGYPATYKNFRNASETEFLNIGKCIPVEKDGVGFLKKLKK